MIKEALINYIIEYQKVQDQQTHYMSKVLITGYSQ